MIDFNHILSTPGYNLQQFYSEAGTTRLSWQTWQKPRGVSWVYMIGVGGGGSGATASAIAAAGGGGGGGSGAQTTVMIPAQFVPDTLYIQAGFGGLGPTTAGATGVAGIATYVAIEPSTTLTANMLLLVANGGGGGGAATTTAAGTQGTAGVVATIGGMCLAGRGVYNFLAGQIASASGASTAAGTNLTVPTTGLMVTGGGGAGGGSATPGAGANISGFTGALGTEFFPLPLSGAAAASGATPAGVARNGFISRNYLMNFGGAGGGGATTTAGGVASQGGDGAPGCGGGGGGGLATNNTTVARGGNGGGGFVYIISW